MEIKEYEPNSHKYREQQNREKATGEKKVERVISGGAKTRKKNELQKFADVFISEDITSVKNYIVVDVLVPAVKKAISDVVTNGIDMILYGSSGNPKRTSGVRSSYISYASSPERRNTEINRMQNGRDFNEIIFTSRGDAEAVLSELDELISVYHVASIMDLYSAAGLQCDYTYDKYGWSNIRGAKVMHVKEGYVLKMPKAMPID